MITLASGYSEIKSSEKAMAVTSVTAILCEKLVPFARVNGLPLPENFASDAEIYIAQS